ncbi:MAG: hypothetical protein VKI83_05765 [Synechococcaceae cyanobacterium]|nr:hypothetical protein [Synechococcaceae cyanobacterium]
MPATKLSDSQKAELVERYRAGTGTQELADAYGCSANTISRVVRSALDPAEYESLKQSRTRRSGAAESAAASVAEDAPRAGDPDGDSASGNLAAITSGEQAASAIEAESGEDDDQDRDDQSDHNPEDDNDPADDDALEDDDPAGVLAIEDADDFGDDDGDDDDLDDEDEHVFVAVTPGVIVDDQRSCSPIPLLEADLPPRAYMLVEKTVELQPRPLSDFPELGRLADGEAERQALVLYLNPGQAKRQCGRSQRVIPIPATTALLERTAAKLRERHGITRVVIEGALYALPGS